MTPRARCGSLQSPSRLTAVEVGVGVLAVVDSPVASFVAAIGADSHSEPVGVAAGAVAAGAGICEVASPDLAVDVPAGLFEILDGVAFEVGAPDVLDGVTEAASARLSIGVGWSLIRLS